ncbi:putative Zn-dependent protease [Rubidibacter lacunae KORDI 51-2]|uniref:Putative Zn-dependent protease n=1 Tax=Rubidibacter lacunae KORDI 51-2 TaxID=582515 RepID=U5DN99_9CHRO|nr:metallopeptidase TldD-related protein [Rubidibacter lacunae]ERN42342.1 putative Zn-dependent protease [Rubidibacter lacunae KORDI 51-2]
MTAAFAPSWLDTEAALDVINFTVSQSEADGCQVNLRASSSALSRFSENQIGQNLSRDRCQIAITSTFGQSSATTSTTELDRDAIQASVRRAEALARVAPADPERLPLLEPQSYDDRLPAFDDATANCSPRARGEAIRQACQQAASAGVTASGTFSTEALLTAVGNSQGLRACDRLTEAEFSFSARVGFGSSWTQQTASAMADLPIETAVARTIARARASQSPRAIAPGTYPVIFEAQAFASLLAPVAWDFDARAADEGRSFLSAPEGGNRVGEELFSPIVHIRRDPAHPLLQSRRFFSDGWPNSLLEVVRDGVPQTLSYNRFWAQQQGRQPTGPLFPIVMSGSHRDLAELIAETERGILVSRAWYVRYVNPRTLEVTGMTRDGTFWIENGAIAYPIANLRFNQKLPEMLRHIDAVAREQRFGNTIVPGVRTQAFSFSSITDSI